VLTSRRGNRPDIIFSAACLSRCGDTHHSQTIILVPARSWFLSPSASLLGGPPGHAPLPLFPFRFLVVCDSVLGYREPESRSAYLLCFLFGYSFRSPLGGVTVITLCLLYSRLATTSLVRFSFFPSFPSLARVVLFGFLPGFRFFSLVRRRRGASASLLSSVIQCRAPLQDLFQTPLEFENLSPLRSLFRPPA